MLKKNKLPEKINRYEIEEAESKSRADGNKGEVVFVDTVGTALNLIMDKIDEILSYLETMEGERTVKKK